MPRRLVIVTTGVCLVLAAGVLRVGGARPAAAATTVTYTYSVATRGTVRSDVAFFAAHAQRTFDDYRGWGLGGSIRFTRVSSGGNFTLWLAQASQVPSFGYPCSSTYSCQVGRDVIVNDDRWSYGSPYLSMGLDDYRVMVVNHETGHWLGFGHSSCPGSGQAAYVMQQQSKGGSYLGACRPNAWPRREERETLARWRGVAILSPSLVWRPFQAVGAPPGGATSGPDVASSGPGRLDVFVRGADNALWHRWHDGAWSAWVSLGGVLTSDPTAVSWSAGRLDVFVRGTDSALWRTSYQGGWGGWTSLGGVLTSSPDVASTAAGRLDVFVRGTDDALWQRSFNGSWGGWVSRGGVLTSDPAAASWGAGRLDVFVRGTDNALWRQWYEGGWSGWELVGGVLTSGPDAASRGFGRLDIFVRGTDDALWHTSFDGRWGAWGSLGGQLTSGPGAASRGEGRLDVVVRGTDDGLWQTSAG